MNDIKFGFKLGLAALAVMMLLLTGCASLQETFQTTGNRQAINENIPVPEIDFSSRRWVLMEYYSQVLDKPRLRTCTMITSRGGNTTGFDLLGVVETIGMPVNLSNQVTDPSESEPDSVYPGPSDQTVIVLRNGLAMVAEGDTYGLTGDCPPGIKPDTQFQQIIDYMSGLEGGDVNFLPPEKTNP